MQHLARYGSSPENSEDEDNDGRTSHVTSSSVQSNEKIHIKGDHFEDTVNPPKKRQRLSATDLNHTSPSSPLASPLASPLLSVRSSDKHVKEVLSEKSKTKPIPKLPDSFLRFSKPSEKIIGTWPTIIYLLMKNDDSIFKNIGKLSDKLQKIMPMLLMPKNCDSNQNSLMNDLSFERVQKDQLHISQSKVLPLQYHHLEPFSQMLHKEFDAIFSSISSVEVEWKNTENCGTILFFLNDSRDTIFITLGVNLKMIESHNLSKKQGPKTDEKLSIIRAVDKVCRAFGFPTFFPQPKFHVTIASIRMKEDQKPIIDNFFGNSQQRSKVLNWRELSDLTMTKSIPNTGNPIPDNDVSQSTNGNSNKQIFCKELIDPWSSEILNTLKWKRPSLEPHIYWKSGNKLFQHKMI